MPARTEPQTAAMHSAAEVTTWARMSAERLDEPSRTAAEHQSEEGPGQVRQRGLGDLAATLDSDDGHRSGGEQSEHRQDHEAGLGIADDVVGTVSELTGQILRRGVRNRDLSKEVGGLVCDLNHENAFHQGGLICQVFAGQVGYETRARGGSSGMESSSAAAVSPAAESRTTAGRITKGVTAATIRSRSWRAMAAHFGQDHEAGLGIADDVVGTVSELTGQILRRGVRNRDLSKEVGGLVCDLNHENAFHRGGLICQVFAGQVGYETRARGGSSGMESSSAAAVSPAAESRTTAGRITKGVTAATIRSRSWRAMAAHFGGYCW
ncbi:hypothetical protein Pd630_LPD10017 (plasmid) [Rhodococcus opacus PD630]|nr:hypothetical protein Pd630_LPD10017 [Rhodococcus opacus PD630]